MGIKRKIKLLKYYKTPKELYKLEKDELLKINEIKEKDAEYILNKFTRKNVDRHIDYMKKNNIDIININDKEYPKLLRKIYDPPISLYIKGNKDILNNSAVAIIGCREATEYGKKAAKYFSYNITKQNINIVSGLAKGIDSYAHIGNICAQCEENNLNNVGYGKTIAIVGNGLDIVYPNENKNLFDMIIKTGGAVISEYPLGTKPLKMNFPARNRIVSGISKSIIVIEAKKKSGTLITVDFALEQGRDVYVVPRKY